MTDKPRQNQDRVLLGGGFVDLRARRGVLRGQEFKVTSREAALVRYLSERAGLTVSTEELLVEVWEYAPGVVSRAVHNTVRRLRNKVEDEPGTPVHLLTEHGVGFRWEAPAAVAHEAVGAAPERGTAADLPWAPSIAGRFIGRTKQMELVLAALETGARLVTLTGAGGIGKTRLAGEVARRLVGDVRFVALESARTRTDILRLVARALGIRLGREPMEAVGTALEGLGAATVVIDNLEQVHGTAAGLVSAWMARSEVRWIATSRIALDLPDEEVVDVPPLAVSPRSGGLSEAAGLLRARVASIDPRIAARADTKEVERLAGLLAGVPLAVELAAPWVARSGFADVEAQLRHTPLGLGDATATGRHASLTACLAWGWGLLSPAARTAAQSASVMEAPFDLDGASAVLGFDSPSETLDAITALVDASFLRASKGAQGRRWSWLAPVRAFVREQAAGAAWDRAAERHAAWYAQLGSWRALAMLDEGRGRARLTAAVEDLRAACRRSVAAHSTPGALVRACASGLLSVGDVAGATEVIAEALEAGVEGIAGLRGAGGMAQVLGLEAPLAAALASEPTAQSLPLFLMLRGSQEHDAGDAGAAATTFAEAARAARGCGFAVFAAECDGYAANAAVAAGDVDGAHAAFEAALRTFAELGNPRPAAMAWNNHGVLAWRAGDLDAAAERFARAMQLGAAGGDARAVGNAAANGAMVKARQGDFAGAQAWYDQAVEQAETAGNPRMLARVLLNRAELDRVLGESDRAEMDFHRSIALADRLQIASTRWIARLDLALLFMELGMVARVQALLAHEAVQTCPDAGVVYREVLDLACRAARDDEDARRELLQRSVGADGALAAVALSWAETRAGRREDAQSAAARARQLLEEHPDPAMARVVARLPH